MGFGQLRHLLAEVRGALLPFYGSQGSCKFIEFLGGLIKGCSAR